MNCPYCQNDIHDKAIKCPYCHSYIIEKKKDKNHLRIFNSVFTGVLLSILGSFFIISLLIYNFFDIFLVRYDYKSASECSINREYLTEAISLYNDVNSDTIFSLNEKDMLKISKFLGESEFVKPVCPLGGSYYIDDNGVICCTKHKSRSSED